MYKGKKRERKTVTVDVRVIINNDDILEDGEEEERFLDPCLKISFRYNHLRLASTLDPPKEHLNTQPLDDLVRKL